MRARLDVLIESTAPHLTLLASASYRARVLNDSQNFLTIRIAPHNSSLEADLLELATIYESRARLMLYYL